MTTVMSLIRFCMLFTLMTSHLVLGQEFRPQPLQSKITTVQPMTGTAVWHSNNAASTAPIQLEFAYLKYSQVVDATGKYNWKPVDELLERVSSRNHQAILRWHDTYVGEPTGVPDCIKGLPGYRERTAKSEGKNTGFPDWQHPAWKTFLLEFFDRFAEKYDRDPRIAFVQVGFGLWSEYHIYDGPMQLGVTFPDRDYQAQFLRHLQNTFRETPWMISVDAAGDHSPLSDDDVLLGGLSFGLFDDSFNHKDHEVENAPNWQRLGLERWRTAPVGGEFSFFAPKDQKQALSPKGPYGIPFAKHAARYHVSFIIGDDQPRFQTSDVLRGAGMECGYRFRVTRFASSQTMCELEIRNTGIAPIYFDVFPAVGGQRSNGSLKGLLPGETKRCRVAPLPENFNVTMECDRLVPGQRIEFEADLQ